MFETFDFSRASSFEVEIVDGSLADGDNPAFSSFYDDDLRVVIDGVVANHKLETA